MRKFYLTYPICQNVSDKLNWSQICELITVLDPLERSFYEKECVAENWDVDALRRQMDAGLFLRLAASKDKEGILALVEYATYGMDVNLFVSKYELYLPNREELQRLVAEILDEGGT